MSDLKDQATSSSGLGQVAMNDSTQQASTSGGFVQIIKLTDNNWATWRRMMVIILKARGLWTLVDPNGSSTMDQRLNDQAMAQIMMCMEPDQVILLGTTDSAKTAWANLMEAKQLQSAQSQFNILSSPFHSKMKDGTNVTTHVKTTQGLLQQLDENGFKIPDLLASCFVLFSLPKQFESFVVALGQVDPKLLTLKETCGRVMVEAMRQRSEGLTETPTREEEVALTASKPSTSSNLTCSVCKKRGHTEKKCWEKIGFPKWHSKSKQSAGEGDKTMFLSSCVISSDRFNSSPLEHSLNWPRIEFACASFSKLHWLLDSGASTHICRDDYLPQGYRKLLFKIRPSCSERG